MVDAVIVTRSSIVAVVASRQTACAIIEAGMVAVADRSDGSPGPFQDVLAIETRDTIPPLTKPWRAAPGAFANIIAGASTLTNGGGAVTFTDGSTDVLFHPDAATGGAGFHLDSGETVIAQYSIR